MNGGAMKLLLNQALITAVLLPLLSFISPAAEETANQRSSLWDENVPFPRREFGGQNTDLILRTAGGTVRERAWPGSPECFYEEGREMSTVFPD
jgi:hypothetical protein